MSFLCKEDVQNNMFMYQVARLQQELVRFFSNRNSYLPLCALIIQSAGGKLIWTSNSSHTAGLQSQLRCTSVTAELQAVHKLRLSISLCFTVFVGSSYDRARLILIQFIKLSAEAGFPKKGQLVQMWKVKSSLNMLFN